MYKTCKRCEISFLPVIGTAKYCIECQYFRKCKVEPVAKIAPTNVYENTKHYNFLVRRRYTWLKKSAKNRGLLFELSIAYLAQLMNNPCFYCGAKKYRFSVDRKDNQNGYSDTNCVASCRSCNSRKWTRDAETFMTYYFNV